MTAIKLEPDVKILVYPYDVITKQDAAGLGVSDLLASNINAIEGGGASIEGFGNADGWARQAGFTALPQNIDLIRFCQDGTVKRGAAAFQGATAQVSQELAGFLITPRSQFTNCTLTTQATDNTPQPQNDFKELRWQPLQGEAWETYVPVTLPYRNFIRHRTQRADAAVRIRTVEKLQKQQGFEAVIIWRGIAAEQTQKAGFRVSWCNGKYSVVWRQDHGIELQRKISGQDVLWQTLTQEPPEFTEKSTFAVDVIAGRLVVRIDNQAWWFVETKGSNAVDFRLPAGNLEISSFGVDAVVNIALHDYVGYDEKPRQAILTREVPANFSRAATTIGKVKGWHGAKTWMSVTGSIDHKTLRYSVQMSADNYETPLVSAVMLDFPPTYLDAAEETIDLTPAVMQMGYSGLQPGVTDTAAITIEAFRSTLDDLYPDWQDTVKLFAPITVDVRWKYRDSVTGILSVDADYVRLFEGYITAADRGNDKANARHLSLKATDVTMRLQKPAAFIDKTYLPLDFLMISQNKSALYGAECVQYLLRRVLGDNVANSINGNGDPFRFQKVPYPLLGADALAGYFYTVEPTANSGFYLPPPFGSNIIDWIKTIAEYDRCVFFWGYSPDDPTAAIVPMYGRLEQIMYAGYNQPYKIADSVENLQFVNDFFESVQVQTHSERMYNDFVVWGAKPDGADGLLPSHFTGRSTTTEARDTWKRTLLTRAEFIGRVADAQPLAEAMANDIMNQFAGATPQEVTFKLSKGNAALRWGMKVQADMKSTFSDDGIRLDDVPLRITRVDHQFNFMRDSPSLLATSLTCRTLSATGY